MSMTKNNNLGNLSSHGYTIEQLKTMSWFNGLKYRSDVIYDVENII